MSRELSQPSQKGAQVEVGEGGRCGCGRRVAICVTGHKGAPEKEWAREDEDENRPCWPFVRRHFLGLLCAARADPGETAIAPSFWAEWPAQCGDDLHRGNSRRAHHAGSLQDLTRVRAIFAPMLWSCNRPVTGGGPAVRRLHSHYRARGSLSLRWFCATTAPTHAPPPRRRASVGGAAAERSAPCRSSHFAFPPLPQHIDEFFESFAGGAGGALVFPANREPALLQHSDRGEVVFGDVGMQGAETD